MDDARFFGNGGTGGMSSSSLSSCGGRGNREPKFSVTFGCSEPTDVLVEVLADEADKPEL